MHEQHHESAQAQAPPRAGGERTTFAAPRLQLPRFEFRPAATVEQRPAASPGVPAPRHPATPVAAPAPRPYAPVPRHAPATVLQGRPAAAPPAFHAPRAYGVASPAAPAPTVGPTWQASATALPQRPVAVQYAAAPPAPRPPAHAVHAQLPSVPLPHPVAPAATTAPRAAVSWERLDPPAEQTLLQRISPVHMGVLLVMVMVAMVVTSGPAAMTTKPARLPAVAGGGQGDPLLQPRAGATALEAATVPATRRTAAKAAATRPAAPRTAATPNARAFIRVGNARLRRAVRAGGIPSPAAAANLAVAGGGRAPLGGTQHVQLKGIPSPAASAQLGPAEQTLPFRPTDGVTLPRAGGERDAHATDSHYGADTLPMEQPVELPAMTPGQAAEQAQHQIVRNQLSTGGPTAPNVAGGLIVAQ